MGELQEDSGVAIPEEFSNTSQIAKWILKHPLSSS